jgi:hypothetical protein
MTETNPYETPGNLVSVSWYYETRGIPHLNIALGHVKFMGTDPEAPEAYSRLSAHGVLKVRNCMVGKLGVLYCAT